MKVGLLETPASRVMQIVAQATMYGRALAEEPLSCSEARKRHHLLEGLVWRASLPGARQECLNNRRMCDRETCMSSACNSASRPVGTSCHGCPGAPVPDSWCRQSAFICHMTKRQPLAVPPSGRLCSLLPHLHISGLMAALLLQTINPQGADPPNGDQCGTHQEQHCQSLGTAHPGRQSQQFG